MSYSETVPPARRIQDPEILDDIVEAEHQCRTRLNAGEVMLFELRLFENQRKTIWGNWAANNLLSTERKGLTHGDGTGSYDWQPGVKEPNVAPPSGWEWSGPWRQEKKACDESGWQYCVIWGLDFSDSPGAEKFVRRRVWTRNMVMHSIGPSCTRQANVALLEHTEEVWSYTQSCRRPADVQRAFWGDPERLWEEERGKIVTDIVRERIHSSRPVQPCADIFGDPLPGVRKLLVIEYIEYLGSVSDSTSTQRHADDKKSNDFVLVDEVSCEAGAGAGAGTYSLSHTSVGAHCDAAVAAHEQVDGARAVLNRAATAVSERGHRLADLAQRAEDLNRQSNAFADAARQLRRDQENQSWPWKRC
eukprot:g196.t1